MSSIFISYVEEDTEIAGEIADGLESAGFHTWYYQRDTVPGAQYLIQVGQAIEDCQAIVLVISPDSLGSKHVTNEVVRAYESGKDFVPVLYNITDPEFKEQQPLWRQALGASTSIVIPREGVTAIAPRIAEGLKALGIQPEGMAGRGRESAIVGKTRTPKHLADKIIAARPAIEGERKQVTVLFADVTEFTSLSEPLDPEEAQVLIRPCIDFITEEIHRYEGTVSELTRNGVMALFGAPVAHEDDPQRALYAALGIQERLNNYADELRARNIEFETHIGLNTGLVVVGRILDDLTMEYKPVGSTVDLASEMNRTAEPGSIQVAENAYRTNRDYFDFKPLGIVQVKGQKEPVNTYQLIGAREIQTRIQASLARGLTQFVGRNKELSTLTDAFERVCSGSGQVAGIVGEAGVGKSRLLLEFKRRLAPHDHTYLEGRCIQYGGSMASYLPILDAVRSYFDFREGEQESVAKDKMEQKITRLDENLIGILSPLHDVLSLPVDDEEYLKLDAPIKRTKIFEAIRNVLIRESQERPLVIAIEDLHWIDKTSEEFLDYLIGFLPHARILLLLLYRPEYTHQWGSKSFYTGLNLDQLSSKTSAELVQSILEGGEVAPELRDVILARAAGNPLFMEEFTHSLLENGSIIKKDQEYVLSGKASGIQVPDTIQGIIAARMDRLDESLKQTLQVAAVIGRDFAFRILQAITGLQEGLQSYLLNLQHQEFIYEKSLFPELEYIFKHALTQEVAYNSLLLKRRKEIHERIGKAIEELYADRLEEFYEMLAHHYSRSENLEKAYHYLSLSSVKTGSRNALWESVRLGMEAIDVLRRMPDTDENKRRGVEMRLMLSGPLTVYGFPGDALQVMEEGAALAEQLGDSRGLANLWGTVSMGCFVRGDNRRAWEFAEKAFGAAQESGDPELIGTNGMELCGACFSKGEYGRIVEVVPGVLDVLEKAGMQRRWDVGKYYNLNLYSTVLSTYGQSLGMLGDFQRGQTSCETACRLAEEIGNISTLPYTELYWGSLLVTKGDGRGALEHEEKAIGYAEQGEMPIVLWLAMTQLGHAHYLLGDLDTAQKHFEERNEIYRATAFTGFMSWNHHGLGMVRLDCGDLAGARRSIEESLEFCRRGGERAQEGRSTIALGRVIGKAEPAQSAEAEDCILQGIRMLEELKLRPHQAEGYLFLGELYADSGWKEKALEALKKAEAEFKDMGMDYWLNKTQEALARVEG